MDKPVVQIPLIVLTAGLAFAADILAPRAVAGGLPYLLVMLLALRWSRREPIILTAVACSMLVCLAMFLGGVRLDSWQPLTNRVLSLIGIWTATVVGCSRQDAFRTLDRSRRDLKRRADERANELLRANQELQAEVAERQRAEEAVRTSEALYHSLVDNLSVHVIRKDLEGKFTYASPSFCKLLGRTPDEVLGKTDFDFYPLALARKYRADDRRVIDGGVVLEDVESNQRPDGSKTYVQVMKNPVLDAHHRVIGIQGIFWDVTDRKRAEAELRESDVRKRAIFDASMDCILFIDQDGQIVEINRAAENTFGYRRRELVGQKVAEVLVPVEGRQRHEDNLRRYSGAGELGSLIGRRVESVLLRRDGERFLAEMAIQPIPLRGTGGFAIFLRDITERKQAEQALQEAKEAAEQANRAKGFFLANMSHEIRTPLNAVVGMTDLLRHTPLSGQQREYLAIVQESADLLLTVINDILDFSKIEAGKLTLDNVPFDLQERVGDCLRPLALRADARQLELLYRVAPGTPDHVVGDPHRLRQIIVNMVGNAIKFTPRGEVELSVEPRQVSGDRVLLHFQIRDTGIGIPADKQEVVFSAFEQADNSTTRQFGGTGLGLAIASQLARLMGGRTWVESQAGRGSTFHFTARFRLAPEPGESRDERQRLSGRRVLLVDDNAACRSILQSFCDDWGIRSRAAESLAEALDLLRHAAEQDAPFELVVCDASLGDARLSVRDGFGLPERMREQLGSPPPVLMLLNSGRPGDVERCEQPGIAGYLLKPVKPRELRMALDHALRSERLPRQGVMESEPWEPPLRCLHILLAEDSQVNQKLAVALLQRQGHTVRVAATGREALRAVREESFDLVLMDVQMPEMDGLEATRRIRRREATTALHLPIVAMTAHAMKGDDRRCRDAGMDAYLSKPIRAATLYQVIAEVIRGVSEVSAAGGPRDDAHHVFFEPPEVSPSGATPVPGSTEEVEAAAARRPPAGGGDAAPRQLDPHALRSLVRGDETLLVTLVETFLGECPRLLDEAEQAVASEDASAVQRASHTLKSSLGYFGATQAARDAGKLEAQAKAGRLDEAGERLRALRSATAGLLDELRDLLAETEPTAAEKTRPR